MRGREENKNKIELMIANKVSNKPEIIKLYMNYFNESQTTTKRTYLFHVLDFLSYLNNNGYDIYDINSYNVIKAGIIREYFKNGIKSENKESLRNVKLSAIKHFFKFLVDDEYIDKNPCDKIKPIKSSTDRDIVVIEKKELNHIKSNIKKGIGNKRAIARQKNWKNRDLLIVTLGCSTGLRVTAMTEINIEDIDLNNNIITVTEKENKTKDIYIGDRTKEILEDWINDRNELLNGKSCDALFISNQRTRITSRSVERILSKYTSDINKHITPHKMRSTYATNLYDKTGDIFLVKDMLGHESTSTTSRYARVSEERKQKAALISDVI